MTDTLRTFVLDEVNGMIDSLDETVTQENMGRVLFELRDAVRDGTWQPTSAAKPSVPATDLPQLRYSADLHAGRLRARVRELPDSYRRDAALMTEAADQLEYLSRAELDNHHAADMCPYCTPDPARRDQVDVDELMHELFPERQGDDRG